MSSLIIRWFIKGSAIVIVVVTAVVIMEIFINGIPHIDQGIFSLKNEYRGVSLASAVVATLYMIMLALFMAVPTGVMTAAYLEEYAKRDSLIVMIIRTAVATLAGTPSIVYGLFGYIFFVIALGFGYSLIAGAATLAVMVLPVIITSCEAALRSVPMSYREGSRGLGIGKFVTFYKIILPAAKSGILSGIILAIGKMIGECAALIFTAGTISRMPESLMDSAATLSVRIYMMISEGLDTDAAYASATVLIILIAVINLAAEYIAGKIGKAC